MKDKIKTDLGPKILNWYDKSPKRIYIDIKPSDIVEVVKYFHKDLRARFNIASGIHTPKGFEILYHFAFDSLNLIVSIRILLDKDKPEVSSVTPVMKAGEWIEREMWELLGIQFKGHPDMRKLLLPPDWPEGQCPLRRDYITEEKPWRQ